MIQIIISFTLLVLITLFLIVELSTIIAYGKIISSKESKKYLNLNIKDLTLNSLDSRIIMLYNIPELKHTFISTINTSIISKYYIDDIGIILRWSKLHKQIDYYYEELSKP